MKFLKIHMATQLANLEINQQESLGFTALILASKQGKKEIVRILIQHKNIDINQQDKLGYTARLWAFGNGHTDIVQMLDDKVDKGMNNPFAIVPASFHGHRELVKIYLMMLLRNF